jgi:hypothetical protein
LRSGTKAIVEPVCRQLDVPRLGEAVLAAAG